MQAGKEECPTFWWKPFAQGSRKCLTLMLWQGKLRIGLAEQTVLVALAHATLLERGSERERQQDGIAGRLHAAEQAVKLAYSQCPSYELLVPALLAHPVMARRPCRCVP